MHLNMTLTNEGKFFDLKTVGSEGYSYVLVNGEAVESVCSCISLDYRGYTTEHSTADDRTLSITSSLPQTA
ncbi:hypothetical protein BDF14DRAFT_1880338 [Spinellus fusiger]|nr:hypothetical protein BDF14DRAFT_1880335 [Spinellus fusiger]KAI7869164.1 hypothetical protein BDF14DRAFT_1880338 [Spinellus fusiger]